MAGPAVSSIDPLGMMIDESSKSKFLTINPKDELKLLEELAFELAMTGKIICTGETLSRDEKLTGLKQLNEITLRVLNINLQIRNGDTWSNKESTLEMICNYAKRAPHITHWVSSAIIRSLQSVDAYTLQHKQAN